MSVIAKMNVQNLRSFSAGRQVDLMCVCENDLMAMYAGADEDRLFTKASPNGDARATISLGVPEWRQFDTFYVLFGPESELAKQPLPMQSNFVGASLYFPARCLSVTDFGGTSRRVEFQDRNLKGFEMVKGFNWRMTVDNPLAYHQYAPGRGDEWIAFYRAEDFTVRTATEAFHGA